MRCRFIAVVCVAASLACARVARADDDAHRWMRRPIVVDPWSARFDVGVASAEVPTVDGTRSGIGTSFEAVVGLPILVELGVRVGDRPSEGARIAGADSHARLFDHESTNAGGAAVTNPEIRARFSALDFGDVALAFEGRFVVPRADGTHFTFTPGAPVRIRIAHVARVDTGLWVPFRFFPDAKYTFDVPVELWLQAGDFFFGPMTGVRVHHFVPSDGSATSNRLDVAAGLGAGFTFFGVLDLKAQAYTLRINDAEWKHSLGFGVGLGVTTP